MFLHGDIDPEALRAIRNRLARVMRPSETLEEAAQVFVSELHAALEGTAALSRVYVTVPFRTLAGARREFAERVARDAGVGAIQSDTTVLTLIGSAGDVDAWNDPLRSRGHLAIPLLSAAFIEDAPMLRRMLDELGVDVGEIARAEPAAVQRAAPALPGGVFHIEDARAAKDESGRHIIPAQDFVRSHGIKTVFGFGGRYALTRSMVVCVVFTHESRARHVCEQLAVVMSTFKTLTASLIRSGRVFGA